MELADDLVSLLCSQDLLGGGKGKVRDSNWDGSDYLLGRVKGRGGKAIGMGCQRASWELRGQVKKHLGDG